MGSWRGRRALLASGFALALLIAGFVGLVLVRGPRSFTIIALPDTQYYAEQFPDIYEDQVRWILDEAEVRNIVLVVHLGDIVEHYDREAEWLVADELMGRLDGVIPYAVLPGNHDMSAERDTATYNRYFPPGRFSDQSWYGDGYPGGTNDNGYQLFQAGGYDFLLFKLDQLRFVVVNLEFCPTSQVVEWASGVFERHPDRLGILVTHAYLNYNGVRHINQPSGGCTDPKRNTQYLFDQLIYPNPNVFMVLSGHEYLPERAYGEAYVVDRNVAGRPVHQMLADFQRRPNGGDGWLRILGFNQELGQVIVRTYSPTVKSYERDEDSDFRFDLPDR